MRVKTEEEFRTEFGVDWRRKVLWNDKRDVILGRFLNDAELAYFKDRQALNMSYSGNRTATLTITHLTEDSLIEF
jgi:hypothetical protein